MTSETGEITESARRLVDNLATLQHALAGRPDGERRQAIEGALREALSGLDPRRAEQLLARCRDLVLDRARDRDERTRAAETDAARLKVEVESLRAERDRLRSDNTRLEALAKVKDAGGSGLDQLLVELRTLGDESAPQQIAPGLAGSEARILATSHALVWFAFNLGRQLKFFEANVLSEGSVIIKEYEKRFRRLYLESLDGKDGAIEKLRQLLGEMALFVGRVDSAWRNAVPLGAQEMLAQLDSESLKANYRRFGSVDYEKVVKDIDKKRDNMLAMDLLEFFKPQFEKKFSEERARGAGS